jgi:hypothetical protein
MTHSIGRFFAGMPEPRRDQGKPHQLSDMIVIAVCAVTGRIERRIVRLLGQNSRAAG